MISCLSDGVQANALLYNPSVPVVQLLTRGQRQVVYPGGAQTEPASILPYITDRRQSLAKQKPLGRDGFDHLLAYIGKGRLGEIRVDRQRQNTLGQAVRNRQLGAIMNTGISRLPV